MFFATIEKSTMSAITPAAAMIKPTICEREYQLIKESERDQEISKHDEFLSAGLGVFDESGGKKEYCRYGI